MNRIGWISLTRVIAVTFIVMLHSASFYFNNFDIGVFGWEVGNLGNAVSRWGVPVFIMLSGALLLNNNNSNDYASFYKRRLSKILIPLIFWSIFYSAIWLFQNKGDATIYEALINIISGHPFYHMWFMYMILGLYAFTPLFRKIASVIENKEATYLITTVFMLSAVWISNKYITDAHDPLWFFWFIQYLPYYFAGYYISKSSRNIKPTLLLIVTIITVAATFIATHYASVQFGKTQYFYEPLSPFIIIMSLCVFCLFKRWNSGFPDSLANLSLGVYLIHPFFLLAFFKVFKGFSMSWPLMGFICAWIICTVLSFASTFIIKKVKYLNVIV